MKTIMRIAGRSVMALLLLVALSVAALAQAPEQNMESVQRSKVERMNKAPISNEILHVTLPRPFKATLPNGVRVLILEDHRFATVTTQLMLNGAGALYDPAGKQGTAEMTAGMLRQGTKTRNAKQLAEEIEKLGAQIQAGTRPGDVATTLRASGLSENFEQWFDIAVDVLLHPTFPATELSQAKQRQTFQLRQQRSQPTFLANERFLKAVYGDHPAATVSPTAEQIQSQTPEMLAAWHDERYVPQNAILAISGDVKPAELMVKLKQWLGDWKQTSFKPNLPANPTAATVSKIFLVDRPGSVQTNLLLGNLALDRRSPDFIAATVMNTIVGGGAGARLFMNLREDHGYTYGAYSRLSSEQYVGTWVANSEVRTDVTNGAMTEFFNEIHRIVEQPVPADELQRAKRAIVARFALSLERPQQTLDYAVTSEVYGFPADYWDNYAAQVMKVTPADIQRVAKKYVNAGAIQVVAVGDASKIKTWLEKYGTVEVTTADVPSRQGR